MKKRLPILMVFGAALLTGVILYFAGGTSAPKEIDTDKDGFPDRIDKCKTEYSNKNSGCPEAVQSGEDKDKDGRYAEFQKDTALFDQNDNNPCIPNPTCDYCDSDGDGLTYPQERAKNTEPTLKDTDGDGVNDKLDRCPREYGIADNDGCKLVIDVMLNRIKTKNKKQRIIWNSQLINHCERIMLTINDYEADKTYEIPIVNKTEHTCKSGKIDVFLTVVLKNPKAVRLVNNTKKTFE